MATGPAWHIYENDDPTQPLLSKPWTEHDKDDILDYPVDWSEFLAETLATIVDQTETFPTTTPANPMKVVSSVSTTGNTVRMVRIGVDSGVYTAAHENKTFPVRMHMTDSNGQEKDRTLWFKIKTH